MCSIVAAKRADAAADLAAKEAEYEVLLEEEKQRLKAEKDVKAARADSDTREQHVLPQPFTSSAPIQPTGAAMTISPPQTDFTYLAQAVQDSMTLNRLPIPEPCVFTGDPIQFIEWKASFTSLIDKSLTNSII